VQDAKQSFEPSLHDLRQRIIDVDEDGSMLRCLNDHVGDLFVNAAAVMLSLNMTARLD
jgi:hypothetical protein